MRERKKDLRNQVVCTCEVGKRTRDLKRGEKESALKRIFLSTFHYHLTNCSAHIIVI